MHRENLPNSNSTIELSWDQCMTGDLPEPKKLFHQAVIVTTLEALDALPDANGRVERARDLVLTGAVTLQDNATFFGRG
jgi:hypothetical protein